MDKKFEEEGRKAIITGELEYLNNDELVIVSLKVLDTIHNNTEKLPVKYALMILDDAKEILMQLVGV